MCGTGGNSRLRFRTLDVRNLDFGFLFFVFQILRKKERKMLIIGCFFVGTSSSPKSKTMANREKEQPPLPVATVTENKNKERSKEKDRFAHGRPVPKKQGSWWVFKNDENNETASASTSASMSTSTALEKSKKDINGKVEKLIVAKTTSPVGMSFLDIIITDDHHQY